MAEKTAVTVKGLVQEFKLGEKKIPVLHGVNLSISEGEFVCLLGPSGSGKSTILNLIGGLDRFVSGSIVVDKYNLAELDENELAHYRRAHLGFMFQSYNLIPTLTARANVELPLIFAGVDPVERRIKADAVLDRVGLKDRKDHRPIELSGGEQQRVAVARALINEPRLVLGDEPTGNLDSKTGREILELLRELNRANKQTFIVVTHNPEVSEYADRILTLRDGVIANNKEKV